ncbi:hypothetical protein NEAUS03_1835 [Nematocida ausubeli]|nr:hypothetical protein NEAUS03_1835 [Nematocida ausubeli]
MMGEFAAEEWLERSVRRSRDAYSRIKMNLTVRGKDVIVSSKYKEPVERIKEVIKALDGIERAKSVLMLDGASSIPEKKVQEYKEYKEIAQDLKAYRKTEIISSILERVNERLQEIENSLNELSKKRLVSSLQGKSHENWAEFLVDKDRKTQLFLVLVEKYAETVVKHNIKEDSAAISTMVVDIEILAKRGFAEEQASSVIQGINKFIGMQIVHHIGKQCYIFIKGLNAPIRKLEEFLEFICGFLSSEIEGVMKKQRIHAKVRKLVVDAYKTLYTEAEEQFITGAVNQKRLLDRDLFYLIESLYQAEKIKGFLDIKQHLQRKLGEFYKISEKKAKRTTSKLESLIFSLNSAAIINTIKHKKIETDEIAQEVAQEMRRKVEKAVDAPEVKNKIGELLKHIERAYVKAKHYNLPVEHKAYIVLEYKKTVRDIGNRFGGLDDVSDSHLSSIIEGFFNGPERKILK